MRWNNPSHMTTRIRSGFLWFPKCIEDETRWLEKARWAQQYTSVGTGGYWRDHYWMALKDEN